ncbi:MAG: hypothetical protein H7A55_21435 [Verrucomicrobiaceae bacterium]|nr:hypothetical protein [Verrucomicrobiaceae bacterium]
MKLSLLFALSLICVLPGLMQAAGLPKATLENPYGVVLISGKPDMDAVSDPSSVVAKVRSGTAVEVIGSPVRDPRINVVFWSRVRVLEGSSTGTVGWVSRARLKMMDADQSGPTQGQGQTPAPRPDTAGNGNGGMMLLARPDIGAGADRDGVVAVLPENTPVEVMERKPSTPFDWMKIRVAEGPDEGKIGWISINQLRDAVLELKFAAFIPSPAAVVRLPILDVGPDNVAGSNVVENWVLGGDNRGFNYQGSSSRAVQKITVRVPWNERPTKLVLGEAERVWGQSSAYRWDRARRVPGMPTWWVEIADPRKPSDDFGTLRPTNENSRITVWRTGPVSIKVQFFLSGGFPLMHLPLNDMVTPAIDADVTMHLRRRPDGAMEYMLEGAHDGFPAYELYINRNLAYSHDPVKQKQTPLSLFPPMEFKVNQGWQRLPVRVSSR